MKLESLKSGDRLVGSTRGLSWVGTRANEKLRALENNTFLFQQPEDDIRGILREKLEEEIK